MITGLAWADLQALQGHFPISLSDLWLSRGIGYKAFLYFAEGLSRLIVGDALRLRIGIFNAVFVALALGVLIVAYRAFLSRSDEAAIKHLLAARPRGNADARRAVHRSGRRSGPGRRTRMSRCCFAFSASASHCRHRCPPNGAAGSCWRCCFLSRASRRSISFSCWGRLSPPEKPHVSAASSSARPWRPPRPGSPMSRSCAGNSTIFCSPLSFRKITWRSGSAHFSAADFCSRPTIRQSRLRCWCWPQASLPA